MKIFAIITLFFVYNCSHPATGAETTTEEVWTVMPELLPDVYFDPKHLKFKEKTSHIVKWYTTLPGAHRASISNQRETVASVTEFDENFDPSDEQLSNVTGYGYLNVSLLFIGYNNITLTIHDTDNQTLGEGTLTMAVLLSYRELSLIFVYTVGVLLSLVYINMGATLDLSVVKQIFKRPVGPAVGIICQYCFMPVIAFGLAKLYFPGLPLLQLGMFLNGASPGGGQSNIWTYLLGGSLDLSIMMTFSSTLVAFGAVPMWVFLLGPLVVEDAGFTIPYMRIFTLVVGLMIPCSIGLGIQYFFPKVAKFIKNYCLTPVSFFNAIVIVTFGCYANTYIFSIFTWKTLIASFSLPVLGYLTGVIAAKIAGRPWNEVIAIGIETGVQNTNIAVVILKLTLEEPAGDLTVVIPAGTAILTPIPLLIMLGIKKTYDWFCKSDKKDLVGIEHKENAKNGVENDAYLEQMTPTAASRRPNTAIPRHTNKSGIDNPSVEFNEERI